MKTENPPKQKKDSLLLRVVMGVIFAPLLLWSAVIPSLWGLILWLAIALLACVEFFWLAARAPQRAGVKWITLFLEMFVLILALPLILKMANPFSEYAWLRNNPNSLYTYAFPGILLLTWTVDTAAYFGGKLFAKRDGEGRPLRPLARTLSPNKSWEGAVIGWLAAVATGMVLAFVFNLSPRMGAGAGTVVGLVGQLGDLLESVLKRSVGAKDSGFLPGHGGILDRFDAFFTNMALLSLLFFMGVGR